MGWSKVVKDARPPLAVRENPRYFKVFSQILISGSDGKKKKKICLQYGRPGFDPWRREWQPTSVFLLGELHGQRSLVGYSPRCHN